jgi:signal transduction histidine kinase
MAVLFLGIIYVLSAQNKRNLELKEALSEIEIQKQELQFSNSNINYLLQTVAHDLRTPVGNNLSLSNLLLESLKLHPEDKDLVKMMNTSSQHALSIMEDLLDHSLIERGEIILNLNNFNLNELIIEAVQVLNYKADTKGIKIITKLPENSIYANIDGSRISRVIQNLITNAIKFSQNNKSIIIELIENPEKYIISVKDFGIGMDEITIEFAFDSFTSVGRTGTSGEKSYGLGLSICKKLVELHFGRLYVESIAGNGSTFYIEIPKLN